MKKFLLAAAAAALMSGTAFAGNIGVSMANSDTFLTVLRKGIEASAAAANQPVQIEIADDDVSKQLSQIQNFIAAKVDAIIVNAVDTSATAPMTKLANDAGIPIVYVNRQPADIDAPRQGCICCFQRSGLRHIGNQRSLPPAQRSWQDRSQHSDHGWRPWLTKLPFNAPRIFMTSTPDQIAV